MRNWKIAFALVAVAVAVELATGSPGRADIAGCPMFPADNIWNARVDSLPVHPRSDDYINSIGRDTGLHPDFGSGTWDGGPIGIPYTTVPGTQPRVNVTFGYADESDPGPYPIPPDPPIEGGSGSTGDRHVLIVDRDVCRLYELYAAYPQPDGSWHAGSGAVFDLHSNVLRPATWTSADAAGFPILAGLARYDEVASGEIRHALRFTARRTQRAYVWPARHFASSITDPSVPPMGQRFRLKASFDLTPFPPEVRVILQALKTYGMKLADNGSDWFISGAPDPRWNNEVLVTTLRQVRGRDFEAVDVSGLMADPDSGRVAGSGPGLTLALNHASFRSGETLRVTVGAHNDGPAVAVDFYFAVRLPDGETALFLQSLTPPSFVSSRLDANPRTFSPAVSNAMLPTGFDTVLDDFVSYNFSGTEPAGAYLIVAALLRAGALSDGSMDPADVLSMETRGFRVEP